MDGGDWWAAVHGVVKSQDTTERLTHILQLCRILWHTLKGVFQIWYQNLTLVPNLKNSIQCNSCFSLLSLSTSQQVVFLEGTTVTSF